MADHPLAVEDEDRRVGPDVGSVHELTLGAVAPLRDSFPYTMLFLFFSAISFDDLPFGCL